MSPNPANGCIESGAGADVLQDTPRIAPQQKPDQRFVRCAKTIPY